MILLGDVHGVLSQPALHRDRQVGRDGRVVRAELSLPLPRPLESHQRRIHRGAFLLEQRDEVLHRLRVEVERAGLLGDQVEPSERSRVGLRFGQKVEQELVDVRDLIVAGAHRLGGQHEGRDVTGDAQAKAVGVFGDRRDPLGLDRIVELDLTAAVRGIPVHRAPRFLDVLHHESASRGELTLPFDVSAHLDTRPYVAQAVDSRSEREQGGIVIAFVTSRGDAARDMQERAPRGRVVVHVEESGKQRLASRVEDGGSVLLDGAGRPDARDPAIEHEHITRWTETPLHRVEDTGIPNQDGLRQPVRQAGRQVLEPLPLGRELSRLDPRRRGLPAFQHQLHPAWIHISEQLSRGVVGQPEIGRLEIQSGQGVEGELLLSTRGLSLVRGDSSHRDVAGGQGRDLATGPLQGRAGEHRVRLHRRVDGHVERCGGDRLGSAVGDRLPVRHAALALEVLGRRSAERGLPSHAVLDLRPCRVEANLLLVVGTATVVAIAVIHGPQTIRGLLRDLTTFDLALEEDAVTDGRGDFGCRRHGEEREQERELEGFHGSLIHGRWRFR
jgi:hypothetical protein